MSMSSSRGSTANRTARSPSASPAVSRVRSNRVWTQRSSSMFASWAPSRRASSRPRSVSGTGTDGSPLTRPSWFSTDSACRARKTIKKTADRAADRSRSARRSGASRSPARRAQPRPWPPSRRRAPPRCSGSRTRRSSPTGAAPLRPAPRRRGLPPSGARDWPAASAPLLPSASSASRTSASRLLGRVLELTRPGPKTSRLVQVEDGGADEQHRREHEVGEQRRRALGHLAPSAEQQREHQPDDVEDDHERRQPSEGVDEIDPGQPVRAAEAVGKARVLDEGGGNDPADESQIRDGGQDEQLREQRHRQEDEDTQPVGDREGTVGRTLPGDEDDRHDVGGGQEQRAEQDRHLDPTAEQ